MPGLEWFENNIEKIRDIKEMAGTTDDKVFFVNESYVVKETNIDNMLIADWYQYNNVGPNLIKVTANFIIYEYVQSDNRDIICEDIVQIIKEYRPQEISSDVSLYYDRLYDKYVTQCHQLGLEVIELVKPTSGVLCKLHGDFGLHNVIISSNLKMIDPEPIEGVREHDLIQLYVSDPRVMKLFDYEAICSLFVSDIFDFLYPVLLVDRIVRAGYHHSYDLSYYYDKYEKLIKEHKKNLI